MVCFEYMFNTPFVMPNGLQSTDEGIWIVDQDTDDVFLVNEHGDVLRHLKTETENGSGISFGDGALWVSSNGPTPFRKPRPTDRKGKYILKIDPETGKTLTAHNLDGLGGVHAGIHGLQYVNGTLWVARPRAEIIQQVDILDFSLIHQIPASGNICHGLTWEDGYLWCLYRIDRVILKHDPKNGDVLDRIEIPEPYPIPHGLTLRQGHFIYCDSADSINSKADAPEGSPPPRGQVWRIVR